MADPFGGVDVGWAGAFVPLVVSEGALAELRNLAGPPTYPGQKYVRIDLVTGQFQWMARARTTSTRSRRRRR